MTDINGISSGRIRNGLLDKIIADLEKQLAESQENGVQLLKLCSQKTNEIAEKDSEIERLTAQVNCTYSHDLNRGICTKCGWAKMAERIFSGEGGRELWQEINALDAMSTGDDIGDVLYSLCCSLQRLEDKGE